MCVLHFRVYQHLHTVIYVINRNLGGILQVFHEKSYLPDLAPRSLITYTYTYWYSFVLWFPFLWLFVQNVNIVLFNFIPLLTTHVFSLAWYRERGIHIHRWKKNHGICLRLFLVCHIKHTHTFLQIWPVVIM